MRTYRSPGGAAAPAGLAAAGEPQPPAVVDAGRHVDGDDLGDLAAALAAAVGHGSAICWPVPRQPGRSSS
jgi:hypothetical protein